MRRLVEHMLKYRFYWMLGVIILTAFFGYEASKTEIKTFYDDLFPQRHSYIKVHNAFREMFGGANLVSLELAVKEGTIFNTETLNKLKRITQEFEKLPWVHPYQIVSLARRNVKDTKVSSWGMRNVSVMYPFVPDTPEKMQELKDTVYHNDMLYGGIVSLDSKSTLLQAVFIKDPRTGEDIDYRLLFNKINEICDREMDENTVITLSGNPILYGWIYHYLPQIMLLLLVTSLVVLVLLYLYIRSWGAMLVPLSSIIVGIIWGIGFAGLVGFNFDPLILVVPFLISARAASHSVQMVQRYYNEYERLKEVRPAVVESFVGIFTPGVLSMVTDAFGVLCIVIAPIPIIQKLAYIGTVWVMSLVVGGLICDPIILSYLPPPKRFKSREAGIADKFLAKVGTWPFGRARWVILGVALIVLVFGVVYTRDLKVGDVRPGSPILWPDSEYNLSTASMNAKFPGTNQLFVIVEGSEEDVIQTPEAIGLMEGFQWCMEVLPEVGGALSLASVTPKINEALHYGDPKWGIQSFHDDRYMAMLIFMFSQGCEPGELDRFMSRDIRLANTIFYVKDHKGETIERVINRAKTFIEENPSDRVKFKLAGGLIGILAAANDVILRSQVFNLIIVFSAVFLLCSLTYRSIFAGFLFIVSLILANLLAYGFMAMREIGLNVNTLPVAALGVGLGVDYGLYVVNRIKERFEISKNLRDAISTSIATSGKAVFFTATVLSLGVVLWYLSPLRFQAEMGLLLAIIMMTNMLGAMLLLPAIVAVVRPKFIVRGGAREVVGEKH